MVFGRFSASIGHFPAVVPRCQGFRALGPGEHLSSRLGAFLADVLGQGKDPDLTGTPMPMPHMALRPWPLSPCPTADRLP